MLSTDYACTTTKNDLILLLFMKMGLEWKYWLDFLGDTESVKSQAHWVALNIESVGRPLHDIVTEFEKRYIARLLEEHQCRRTRIASILGIGRKTLYRKMKSYGLISLENGIH